MATYPQHLLFLPGTLAYTRNPTPLWKALGASHLEAAWAADLDKHEVALVLVLGEMTSTFYVFVLVPRLQALGWVCVEDMVAA